MAHPRIEEVSDDEEDIDDPEEMDVDAFDFARPQQGGLQSASSALPPDSQISPSALQSLLQPSSSGPNTARPQQQQAPLTPADRDRLQREQQAKSKQYQCIYPVYFDSTRSREQGRRVKKADAVPNPLAREIVDALSHIGATMGVPLQIVLEPGKTHPKDWANPGRVKVLVKREGRAVDGRIKNKHYLYTLISSYLRSHPTTEDSPLRLRVQGMPAPKEKIPPPAVPRGFRIGTILPLHSPALSGGGVSDNFLKDMMAEMGGQLPQGMEGLAGLAGGMGAGGGGGGGQKKVKVIRGKK